MTALNDQLTQAAKAGDAESALALIYAGADVNALDAGGGAALHYACACGHIDMVRLLLAKRADPNLPRHGRLVTRSPASIAARCGQIEILQVLRQWGADFSGKVDAGLTPLHTAAWGGQTETCAFLLGMGLAIDAQDHSGRTPLHWAAGNMSTDTLEFLIESGASLDLEDSEQRTVLETVIRDRNAYSVEVLLQRGARVPDHVLEDQFLEDLRKDASPEDWREFDAIIRMVRSEMMRREINGAFSVEDTPDENPRISSSPAL